MKYFGVSDEVKHLTTPEYLPMAKSYWGLSPLPKGAEIIGGYSDDHRAGALIRLASGVKVCGNAGAITTIAQTMTADEFKQAQGGRTNAEMAEICCCSVRMVEMMRQGRKPVSARTQKFIEMADAGPHDPHVFAVAKQVPVTGA
jgi:hypothetical protein